MRKIRDVLRLHAAGLTIGATSAGDYLRRARRVGLSWRLLDGLSDEALERRLFPPPVGPRPIALENHQDGRNAFPSPTPHVNRR